MPEEDYNNIGLNAKTIGVREKYHENQTFHLLFCISLVAFFIEPLFLFFLSSAESASQNHYFFIQIPNCLIVSNGGSPLPIADFGKIPP